MRTAGSARCAWPPANERCLNCVGTQAARRSTLSLSGPAGCQRHRASGRGGHRCRTAAGAGAGDSPGSSNARRDSCTAVEAEWEAREGDTDYATHDRVLMERLVGGQLVQSGAALSPAAKQRPADAARRGHQTGPVRYCAEISWHWPTQLAWQ